MKINEYFAFLEEDVKRNYGIAGDAKKKGFDPMTEVEIPLAMSLAERVTGLVSVLYPQILDKRISLRIAELEKQYGPLDPAVALTIAEEIAKEKFCKFASHKEAFEVGVRVALGYLTLGYVSSPIEGFTKIEIKKTAKGEDFIAPYFSGPIRSAGGSEAAFSLVIVDYLRERFGYAKYDPTEDEIKRGIHECYIYHERVTNLQYLPSEIEIEYLMKNIPIQLTGDPSEDREVYNYKDLPRVETNMIRSGFALVMGEGIAQKAPKTLNRVVKLRQKGFKLSGWDWLDEFVKFQKKLKESKSGSASRVGATYMQDLVAGRPVFAHPSRSGAFRLRYGRCRNTGYSTLALHPATMAITKGFIAVGTQLKTEKPTKGCTIASCDEMDGPIIKLKDKSVKYLDNFEDAEKAYAETDEILYLGDILVPYGDFFNRNHPLEKPGYIEQYWNAELEKAGGAFEEKVSLEKAIEISDKFNVPLYPKFIYYWTQIEYDYFLALIDWIAHGDIRQGKLVLPYTHSESERFAKGKRALELIGCEHKVLIENVLLNEKDTRALLFNLGIDLRELSEKLDDKLNEISLKLKEKKVLEVINDLCRIKIKDKAGTFVGARMGRPEKAKLRKLTGSPHVLFPVGDEGGRLRSFQSALEEGSVKAEFPLFFCEKCNEEEIYPKCEKCGEWCKKMSYCKQCLKNYNGKCEEHNYSQDFKEQRIDIKRYFDSARKKVGVKTDDIPAVIKGVRGTSNKEHTCEHLAKGILRAKYNLNVNKDGTIRYDMTEMPITHFKPREIGTSIAKLKEMGYEKDMHGKELENNEQILEIFPHDIILPSCPITPDEKADDVFLNVARFLDDELELLYGLKRFFNAKTKDDLAGVLLGCMSPHTSASVVGRIIGFSKVQALLASPYIHAAMRRDCVYPSTKLFFYDNNSKEINYGEIGHFVEKLISDGAKTQKIDSFGTISVENKKELHALGIDPETHELKKKKIKYFIKGPITKEWVKIKTATNREYVMTPTHKFMHIENGKFKFKEAKNVKVDDKLPVLEKFHFELEKRELNLLELFYYTLPEEEKKQIFVNIDGNEIELFDFYKNYGKAEFELLSKKTKLRWKYSKLTLPASLIINDNLLRILGYYTAEGYCRTNKWVSQISFRICNKEMQDYLIKSIKETFNIEANLGENNSKITICSKLIFHLFKSLGVGKGAYSKRVPGFIFGLGKNLVSSYISAFFEGDGSIIAGKKIVFYSVSRSLLDDIALLLNKFEVIGRYFTTKPRLPGRKVLDRYKELGKEPKKHILTHLVLGIYDSFKLGEHLKSYNLSKSLKLKNLRPSEKRLISYNGKQIPLLAQSDYVEDYVKEVEIIKDEKNSYCVEIEWKEKEDRNVLWGEQIINTRCDGDEAAVMLLMDLLLNFSRKFIPSHRGGTQDAPLVLNARIRANEVDDMIFDLDIGRKIPLELYAAGEAHKLPNEIKMPQLKERLGTGKEFENLKYDYETSDINQGPLCSSYKTLPTMQEKVDEMMILSKKIRAVDVADVSRLIIERHFIRDTRGNLRKFSQPGFRCVGCNGKYRRPPLTGKCTKCGGRLIFTISEGSILKYMQPALDLAREYNVSPYLLESLELTERYIQSIFGKDKEKQENINKWF